MKSTNLKRIVFMFLTMALALTTFSCSRMPTDSNDFDNSNIVASDDHSDVARPEIEKPAVNEVVPSGPVNPLTGEATDTDVSGIRPIAVMLNNHAVAQPQLGVGDADIIYEAIVEGGITRMMAVFQELPESEILGSIRSSRHNYLDLVKAYDAIYVHAGGSTYAYDAIASRNIDNIDGVQGRGDLFYRDSYRRSAMGYEHSLCITGKSILDYLNNESGFRLEHNDDYKCNMVFTNEPALVNGTNASNVNVHFGLGKDTVFTYDAANQVYNASQFGSTYVDGNTSEPVNFKNVIIIQTDVSSIDSVDRKEITLTGTGNGWFICNGKSSQITWSRGDNDAQFVYAYADGTPVEYGIGASYICVIAMAGSIECS